MSSTNDPNEAAQLGRVALDNALFEEAASYGLHAVVERATKIERMKCFSQENRKAIESWNDLVEREGLWSDGYRAF